MDFNLFSKNSILSPHDKKQRSMLIILAILIVAILIVVYFGLRNRLPKTPSELPGEGLTDVKKIEKPINASELIEKIDFDIDFLKSSRFNDLKVYGDWPLKIDEKGRANPFLPY